MRSMEVIMNRYMRFPAGLFTHLEGHCQTKVTRNMMGMQK